MVLDHMDGTRRLWVHFCPTENAVPAETQWSEARVSAKWQKKIFTAQELILVRVLSLSPRPVFPLWLDNEPTDQNTFISLWHLNVFGISDFRHIFIQVFWDVNFIICIKHTCFLWCYDSSFRFHTDFFCARTEIHTCSPTHIVCLYL